MFVVDETLGKLITRLRSEKGLSKSALARAMDVTPGAVSQWEADAGGISRQNAAALDGVLEAGGEILRRSGHVTVSAPADLGDMLAEILSEIRTHRASDIAPSAHLLDMPTRDEFTKALEALRLEMRASAAATAAARDAESARLEKLVEKVTLKVADLSKRRPPAPPKPPASPGGRKRIGTQRSRSTRSADR